MLAALLAAVAIGPGLTADLPAGWHLHPGIPGSPTQRMLLTNYPTRATGAGPCGPGTAGRDLPAHGVLIQLLEYDRHVNIAAFPEHPARFALRRRDRGRLECWGIPTYLLRFRGAGRAFQIHVALGPRAGATARRRALAVLDSVRVTGVPGLSRPTVSGRAPRAARRSR
jgi:hypothetical protein